MFLLIHKLLPTPSSPHHNTPLRLGSSCSKLAQAFILIREPPTRWIAEDLAALVPGRGDRLHPVRLPSISSRPARSERLAGRSGEPRDYGARGVLTDRSGRVG